MNSPNPDIESQKSRKRARHWELVFHQTLIDDEVLNHPYRGSGTEDDPYQVEYIPHDRRDPMVWADSKKWAITLLVAFVRISCQTS